MKLTIKNYDKIIGDWVYHFHDGRHKTQSITPAWFKEMGNAVSAVVSEFESQYFL